MPSTLPHDSAHLQAPAAPTPPEQLGRAPPTSASLSTAAAAAEAKAEAEARAGAGSRGMTKDRALTAAGVSYPAKPLITLMQIVQFLAGFTVVWPYKDVPCFRNDSGKMLSWVFNYAYVGGVLLLFMHFFYLDNFAKKKAKAAGASKKSKAM